MRAHLSSLACVLLLAVAGPVLANDSSHGSCSASIGTVAAIPSVAYDPFDGVSRSVTFTVEAINGSSDGCSVGLAVASQMSGSQRQFKMGSKPLRYYVQTSGGSDYPNDIHQPVGSTSLPGGNGKSKTISVVIKVPAGLIGPAGSYGDTLSLQLYRTSDGHPTALGPVRSAPAGAVVEARAQINIAGAAGPSASSLFAVDHVDFGTLTSGEQKTALVQVRTTHEVTFTIKSQNLGRLHHTVLTADPGVAYAVQLDGSAIDLSSSTTLHRTPAVSLDGSSYAMAIKIGDVTGRPAGNYTDMLTITVSP